MEPQKLHAHEEVRRERVEELAFMIQSSRIVERAIVADERTLVVLDGHHRLEALRILRCRRVPVLLVDYHDPSIVVGTWREGEPPPTKEEVLERALLGNPFPPKTTRHPALYVLPEVRIPLSELL